MSKTKFLLGHSPAEHPTSMREEQIEPTRSKLCPISILQTIDRSDVMLVCAREACAWWGGSYCDISGIRVALDEVVNSINHAVSALKQIKEYGVGTA